MQNIINVAFENIYGKSFEFLQADFSFFFDTGGRRRCYIAPERFFASDSPEAEALTEAPLQPSMVSQQM